MSVYNVERRLETALTHLEELDITPKNKQEIKKFLDYIAAHGCKTARQCKYIYPLQNIARWLNKDYIKATKKDIEDLVRKIEENDDYTAWTKQDYMVVIKKFYKWLYNKGIEDEEDWEIPKLVKFIKIRKPKDANTIPSDLLTPKEVLFLAENAKNLREKALILVLYESGARIGELLNLKIKDVEFDDYGAKLRLFGKTGARWIRIVGAAPALSQWLTGDHPKKNDSSAYFFCNTRPDNIAGTQLSYASVRKMMVNLRKRTGIKKNLRPHLWRHARATELAEHLSDSIRCDYFGWEQGSKMARIYTHLADTDKIILEMNGLVKKEKDGNGNFSFVICPRCNTKNSYGSKFCGQCSMGLDIKSIENFETTSREALLAMDKPEVTARILRMALNVLESKDEVMKS